MKKLIGLTLALWVSLAVGADQAFKDFVPAQPAATALAGTEPFPGVQSAATVKITPAQIWTYSLAQLTSANVISKWSGSCSLSNFLRGDGACAAVSLTSNVSGTLQAAQMPAITGDCTTPGASLTLTCLSLTNLTGNIAEAAAATVTSAGRPLTISAGAGGATSGTGGLLTLSAGTATAGSNGGAVSITGTAGVAGGNMSITGGGSTTSTGGSFTMTSGSSSAGGNAGTFFVSSGNANGTGGAGGDFNFVAGHGGSSSGAGGNMSFTAGNAAGSSNAGALTFSSGSATGSGAGGDITFEGGVSTSGLGANIILAPGQGSSTANSGQVALYTASGTAALIIDPNGNALSVGAPADQGFSRQTPANAFSITIPNNTYHLILHPSCNPCATGTVTMPASPVNGQIVEVLTDKTVTALTVSPNTSQAVVNAPTSLTAGTGFSYMWCTTDAQWYRRF